MKVDVYSHCFTVSEVENNLEHLVRRLTRENAEYITERDPQTGQNYTKLGKMWSFANKELNKFHFHISYLEQFLHWLSAVSGLGNLVNPIYHTYPMENAKDAVFKLLTIHDPRDYQEALIHGAVTTKDSNYVITLPPGAGKTLTAKHVMYRIKKRTFIMMRGGYLDRWIPDLAESFDLKNGRMMVVRGQSDLAAVMEMEADGLLHADIIMTTIDTVASYIEDYQKHPHIRVKYKFEPIEFFEKLGVGVVVLDEGHQNPHKVMRVFCHTNVPRFLTLSATLNTRDPFLNQQYRRMYPLDQRHDAGYKNVYIGVNALMYKMPNLKGIRTTGYQGSYSHVNFEQSLMKSHNRKTMAGYLGLVKYSIDLKFMQHYKPGMKCLVFFATVKMCDEAVKYLKGKYPDKKIVRYVSKDKMSVLEEGDIIVSTVLSAGTAVDIINLRTTIMTTAIDSQISNEQSLGRTRPVKAYPDETPEFCYFVCIDIPKHLQYHRNKREAFNGLVKYHTEVQLPYSP